jgi:hypothetical protein
MWEPTTQDWIDLIGVYRCVVRARTGWRFTSTAFAGTQFYEGCVDLGGVCDCRGRPCAVAS